MPWLCANSRPRQTCCAISSGALQRQSMLGRLLDQCFKVAAAHQLRDDERLTLFLAQVEDADGVGVRAEAAHGLALALDALATRIVESFGLNEGKGHVAVELGVVGQVHSLLAALAQELLYLVAAAHERCWQRGGGGRRGR
jgi:hypothetical protein